MKHKLRIQELVGRYSEIVDASPGIGKDELFKKLQPALAKWIADDSQVAEWALFKKINDRVLDNETIDSGQQEFECLCNKAVIALGDGTRITYGKCNKAQLEIRIQIIADNYDAVSDKATREIKLLREALTKMKPDQRLEDIQ